MFSQSNFDVTRIFLNEEFRVLKNHNVIYNPAKFQVRRINNSGEYDPLNFLTLSTVLSSEQMFQIKLPFINPGLLR